MSIKALPSMEHVFSVSIKGSETAQQFDGTFTYRRPNLKLKSEIAKTSAMLDGGMASLDEDTRFMHSVLATLKHTLVKVPDWWEKSDYGFDLYDINVILDVYRACSDFEKDWFARVWDNKSEAKK